MMYCVSVTTSGFRPSARLRGLFCFSRAWLEALRDERTRVYVWLPLGWVLFSAVFHNIWGDELLLFSPHWSWALMALVILGARELSMKFVAAVFVPIVVSQIYTFLKIKSALETIYR